MIITMFLSMFMIVGLKAAEQSNFVIYGKTLEFKMLTRRQSMAEELRKTKFLKRDHRKTLLKYYKDFWEIDRAVKTSSMLDIIPRSLFVDTQFEMFWVFLNKCYFLRHTTNSFKRAVAANIKVEVLDKGCVLYDYSRICENVYYVSRGNIDILSGEDGSSSLLTLGKGSCLGQFHLLQRTVTRFKVIIASYSVVYILNKKDFWKDVYKFRKLNLGPKIHSNFKMKIKKAIIAKNTKKQTDVGTMFRRWRCIVSKKVLTGFKDQIKSRVETVQLGVSPFEDPQKLYTYSKMHSQKSYDEIFLSTSFPWIFQQNSVFISIWNTITIGFVVFVSIVYPYQIAFQPEFKVIAEHVVAAVYILDIVIQLFTAIDNKFEIIRTVEEIVAHRLEKPKFTLDVLAAIPLYLIAPFSNLKGTANRIAQILCVNKLLKLYRIDDIFKELERNTQSNITILRSVKNVLYLSYIGYFCGCIYYLVTCFQATECDEDSWIQSLYRLMTRKLNTDDLKYIDDPRKQPDMISFMNMLMVLSGTTTAFVGNLLEIGAMIIVSVVGTVISVCFFADYVASVTLSNIEAVEFMEFLNVAKAYMTFTNMHDELKSRVIRYFENVWVVNKGKSVKELYFDCPAQLYAINQVERYKGYLLQMDLFKFTNSQLQDTVASRCTELYLPPHEYVIYAGQSCLNCYMVLKGYCGIIEGLSIQKVVSPGDTINAMEIFAGLPSLITVRTETHCMLLKFALEDVNDLVKLHPNFAKEIFDSIDNVAVERIFSRIGEARKKPKGVTVEEEVRSFYVVPKPKRNPLNIDYRKGFVGQWNFLRYILLKRTINPNGPFHKNWELFRAISAVILSLIGPTFFIHTVYFPYGAYLLYILIAISFFDIYLKMHVGYYNKYGLLVTHPKKTAANYFSHSFALDIMSVFPLSWLVLFLTNTRNVMVETYLHFNVMIQMYRYPNAFATGGTRIYRRDPLYITILKTIPFTLVIANFFACILICLSGEEINVNGQMSMQRSKFSWLQSVSGLEHLNFNDPLTFFAFSYYMSLLTLLGSNFNLLRPTTVKESVFFIFCVMIGYLLKLYVTVHVAHNRFILTHKLTQHRSNLAHLSKYMKNETVPKELQNKIIEHYNYVWFINRGETPKNIFGILHVPLKMDVVSFLYRNTLAKIPIFYEANDSFFRHFGLALNEVYRRKEAFIFRVNDIVDNVFIIHKGEAQVLGPDGAIVETLHQGSMFGNLDKIPSTRSMITVCSTTLVDLLVLNTLDMYNILANFEHIQAKLQHYLLLENMSYVGGIRDESVSFEELVDEVHIDDFTPFESFLYGARHSTCGILFDVITSIICCWLVSYQVAFLTPFNFFYIIYILDIYHVVTVVFTMITPYKDKTGKLITKKRRIFMHNLKLRRFYVDIFTTPPYDLIGFAFKNSYHIRNLIGIYRLLRIGNVYYGFDRSNAFGAKVIVLRLLRLSLTVIFMVHVFACFWYFKACPFQRCFKTSWVNNREKYSCDVPYICSIYFTLSILSSTGFRNRVPTSGVIAMLLCSILVIVGQYLMGSILGDIIALVRNSNMDFAEYSFELAIFKTYLENGSVSFPFLQNMKRYCIYLWLVEHGDQVPTYLRIMPKFLLEEVKQYAYGKHIFENVFFADCHRDFLRQLIAKIKMEYFFLDDVICRQEDINNTMYFVHKGTVNVYSITPSEELHVDQLSEFDSFGIIQGLFPNTPHTHTYIANSVCVILYLKYEDISPLLTFYPASKFEIYSNLNLLIPAAVTTTKGRKVMMQSESEEDLFKFSFRDRKEHQDQDDYSESIQSTDTVSSN
nr:uncharacterized protein LOC111421683 [Onthophagus taurus]